MARTLLCEIVTPERIVYTNEVEMVVAMTPGGEVGILPLHAPIVTTLAPGEVRVKWSDGREAEWFAVSGGYMQVHEDKVIILADDALATSQIDVERAKQAAKLAAEQLAAIKADDEAAAEDLEACERDLMWCEIQVRVAERRQ